MNMFINLYISYRINVLTLYSLNRFLIFVNFVLINSNFFTTKMILAVEAVASSIKRTKQSDQVIRAEEAFEVSARVLTSSEIFA